MVDWITGIEGAATGAWMAMALALAAAVLHAVFGAMQKGKYDPFIMRGAMDISYCLMALPLALIFTPIPDARGWLILAGAWVIHTLYKLLQGAAYQRGAYTVVYPVVRGTGPLFTVFGAWLIFDEVFTWGQGAGVAVLLTGIYGLAAFNYRHVSQGRDTLLAALGIAVVTGLFVALYTTYDAFGIRDVINPFEFLLWYFVVDGWFIPILAFVRWRHAMPRPALGPLMFRGWCGGLVAFASFGSVMMATRLDKVGEAAILRETSTVFAALIGWLFLKETVGPARAGLMGLIALGAVIVEFAA